MSEAQACPLCAAIAVTVIDSRQRHGRRIRRRHCTHCGHRWSTVEVGIEHADRLKTLDAILTAIISDLWDLRRIMRGQPPQPPRTVRKRIQEGQHLDA